MRVLIATTLITSLSLVGCSSTTLNSTTGVNRKQLLLVSESEINQLSVQNYNQVLSQAKAKGALNTNHAQQARLQRIANRLITQVKNFRPEAAAWQWQVNLVKSDELNASCAPGGKILFYSGIIDRLKLTDDEIAAIMGHEMAHALREHGRENVSRAYAQQAGLGILVAATGMTGSQTQLASLVSQVGISLPNSRTQESEADTLGLELMARAGYNPHAAVSLWKKMIAANGSGGSQLLSTHPNPENRIKNLEALTPKVMPLYLSAKR